MPWYTFSTSTSELVSGALADLRTTVQTIREVFDETGQVALFMAVESAQGQNYYFLIVPDEIDQYVVSILEPYAPMLCEKPSDTKLMLLVGDEDTAWSLVGA